MKKIQFLIIGLIFSSCIGDGMTDDQREFLDSLPTPDLTRNELEYKSNLEKKGFQNIDFEIPIIGEGIAGGSSYSLSMDAPFNLTIKNRDSIIKANENIAKDLCEKVLSDSMLNDLETIYVSFNVKFTEGKNVYKTLNREYNMKLLKKM
jgi:hypothetical protein